MSLLNPHTRLAVRPPSLEATPLSIQDAYRAAWYGRPTVSFVDLPADLIQGEASAVKNARSVPEPPKPSAQEVKILKVAQALKKAKAPLIVIGKGAAYARAEIPIRELVERSRIPFLPTPMGKGVVPDSHPLNAASARSAALAHADVVLLLGARLNWILHFGDAPKWNPCATFIQADVSAGEIGRNGADAALGLVGDLSAITARLGGALSPWSHPPASRSPYLSLLASAAARNVAAARERAARRMLPLTLAHALEVIRRALHALSPPEAAGIVFVSEGANTMDASRSVFALERPRQRLDAGAHATMGVGLGYAIAAHCACNAPAAERKKVVCLEGDSAFGFSGMEVETMARYGMDVLVFVLNNGGVYHGDADDAAQWRARPSATVEGGGGAAGPGLRSTSLGWEVGYERVAQMCGGNGWVARTEEELEEATRKGFESDKVTVVNVIVEKGKGGKLEFGWQAAKKNEGDGAGKARL